MLLAATIDGGSTDRNAPASPGAFYFRPGFDVARNLAYVDSRIIYTHAHIDTDDTARRFMKGVAYPLE